MPEFFTRMGDGSAVWLSEPEIRQDLEEGMLDAADRGQIPELTDDEMDKLYGIITSPQKTVSIERGNEVVMTFDAGTLKLPIRAGIPMDRMTAVLTHERVLCSDSMEMGNADYSFKQLKNIVREEAASMELTQLNSTIPVFYGAMPNLGLYTNLMGPLITGPSCFRWLRLRSENRPGRGCRDGDKDMVYIASILYEAGADGINFDTVGLPEMQISWLLLKQLRY